ncbi:hypothetical protein TSUD_211140 [Trifolium subterraneum]|uniref:RNase H type-1 domain-containing protein n=1 Tax=Trifolium subterraneum TaxID=3900 RepID=A0A2Z6ND41_TRISU|nr:hypothetical protein TSUD_211140 [Trifolium subterraneum]
MHTATSTQQQEQQIRWMPPPTGYLKCNLDAALFTISNQVGMGASIRDEKGQFVAATTRTMLSNHSDFIVAFTKRQANGSAHALARAALSHASRATFDVISSCITTIIMNELMP